MMEHDDEPTQMRYAQALADWGDAGGYDAEVLWDTARSRRSACRSSRRSGARSRTLSGGEQKRLVLEALLRGPDEVLLLDEPDNYLDVPGKRWLEEQLRESPKTVLFVSHDRELLAAGRHRASSTVELGAAGNSLWVHGGGFATYHEARRGPASPGSRSCAGAGTRSTQKLKALVLMYKQKAAYNDGHGVALPGGADPAAQVRGGRAAAGRCRASRRSRCGCAAGARASARWSAESLELTGLMKPFDLEIWYGDRVAVLGSNGSGKSHFLRLLAAAAPIRTSSTGRSTTSASRR